MNEKQHLVSGAALAAIEIAEAGSAWLDDAAALEAYARAEKIKPAASPATDTTGAFKQTGLEMGIYLIAAQDFVRNDTKYEPAGTGGPFTAVRPPTFLAAEMTSKRLYL